MEKTDPIITICRALSDPGRVEALLALDRGEICLGDMADMLGKANSTVSKHMTILEQAGLVSVRKDGRWRYFRHAQAEVPGPAQHAVAWVRKCVKGTDAITPRIAEEGVVPAACEPKRNVLFLCTGNSCRSQMAEGLCRTHAGDRFRVFSAGIEPQGVDPMTVEVMREIDVDISMQKSKSVLDFIGKMHFEYLITVCPRAEEVCPIFPGVSYRLHWPFRDPVCVSGRRSRKLNVFRQVRDAINERILQWTRDLQAGKRIKANPIGRKAVAAN